MVFKPQVVKKTTLGKWELDPQLPKVKYQDGGRLNLSSLARDIAEKLPVKKFRDRVEFKDVVGQAFFQVWPRWNDYFSPLVRNSFERDVLRAVFKHAQIELENKTEEKVDEKDDNRSDTKRFFKTDGT